MAQAEQIEGVTRIVLPGAMKLFVWEDVLTDYTSGMVVAVAPDLETALQAIKAKDALAVKYMMERDPRIIDMATAVPEAFVVWGGG